MTTPLDFPKFIHLIPTTTLVVITHSHSLFVVDYQSKSGVILSPQELSDSPTPPHLVTSAHLNIAAVSIHPQLDTVAPLLYIRNNEQIVHVVSIPSTDDFLPIPESSALEDLKNLFHSKFGSFRIPGTMFGQSSSMLGHSFRRLGDEWVHDVLYQHPTPLHTQRRVDPSFYTEHLDDNALKSFDVRMISLVHRNGRLQSLSHDHVRLDLPPQTIIESFKSSLSPRGSFNSHIKNRILPIRPTSRIRSHQTRLRCQCQTPTIRSCPYGG